jgi:hypothetical protein
MRRIIYASRATRDLAPDELVDLLATARALNDQAGLTGMLVYAGQSFLQALEGEPEALEETYARIRRDGRHTGLRLLQDVETATRRFPDWSMGFEHADEDDLIDSLDGYLPATVYPLVNPDVVTNGTVAETFLVLYARNRVR